MLSASMTSVLPLGSLWCVVPCRQSDVLVRTSLSGSRTVPSLSPKCPVCARPIDRPLCHGNARLCRIGLRWVTRLHAAIVSVNIEQSCVILATHGATGAMPLSVRRAAATPEPHALSGGRGRRCYGRDLPPHSLW